MRSALLLPLTLSGLFAYGLVACAADGADDASGTSDLVGMDAGASDAAVATDASAASAASAIAEVWDAVDYLPWEYAPDGCFARSYFVALELAARGVPVSQEVVNLRWEQRPGFRPQFAPIDPKTAEEPALRYHGTVVRWDYHIAALLLPPAVPEPTILDKALEPGLVPVATWVNDTNAGPAPQPKSVVGDGGVPSRGFNEFTTPGSSYVGVSPSLAKNWASLASPALSTMAHFRAKDVKLACDTLATIFDCLGAPATEPRRQTLTARANALLASLSAAHLVDGYAGASIACGRTSTFVCAP